MIFFGGVSPAGILELDHPELYSDLLKGKLAKQSRAARHRQEENSPLALAVCLPVRRGLSAIAEYTGNSVPEVHEVCKQMFLPPRQLYRRPVRDRRGIDRKAHDGGDDRVHRTLHWLGG